MPVKIDDVNNLKKSIEEKESAILSTIIACIKNLKDLQKKFGKIKNLCESLNLNVYNNNMINLYSDLSGMEYHELNENVNFEDGSMVKNHRNNYYAYFKKVSDFLDGYELGIQNSLNESFEPVDIKKLTNLGTKIKKTFGIDSFKSDLKKVIDRLESINEIETYSNDIINIKIFAHKPIFIYGYDIVNNLKLQEELNKRYNKTINNLLSIIYDKSNKELLFVYSDSIIAYNLEDDSFKQAIVKLNKSNYLDYIKNNINMNIVEIYKNIELMELKFTDNLYHDNARREFMENVKKQILK